MATERLLLIADPHVPQRARVLPEQIWSEVQRADVVVHACDWGDIALLDELEERSRRRVAVDAARVWRQLIEPP